MTERREGMHRRWSLSYLQQELRKRLIDLPGRKTWAEHESEYRGQIEAWLRGEQQLPWVNADIRLLGLRLRRLGAADALSGTPLMQTQFVHGVAYALLAAQTTHAFFGHWARQKPMVSPIGRLRLIEVSHPLAMATAAGWLNAARRLCAATVRRIPDRVYHDADPLNQGARPARLPFGWFAVKLVADWAMLALPERLPTHPYKAQPYDTLLSCWRDPDSTAIVDALLAVCDWHSHECMYSRSDDPDRDVDFVDDTLMGWPLAVHMVYRLREDLGLPLPATLDHPLMRTGLATYLPKWPEPACSLLSRAKRQAVADCPELAELL